ncbi:MAG: hypothetical protein Q4P30_04020 [Eubacteriales bacterium]|nr:hypothetical protein [Eubacteriales bacterium]
MMKKLMMTVLVFGIVFAGCGGTGTDDTTRNETKTELRDESKEAIIKRNNELTWDDIKNGEEPILPEGYGEAIHYGDYVFPEPKEWALFSAGGMTYCEEEDGDCLAQRSYIPEYDVESEDPENYVQSFFDMDGKDVGRILGAKAGGRPECFHVESQSRETFSGRDFLIVKGTWDPIRKGRGVSKGFLLYVTMGEPTRNSPERPYPVYWYVFREDKDYDAMRKRGDFMAEYIYIDPYNKKR